MGGFRLEDKQYNLIFEDPQFDGMTVSLTGMSGQQIMDFDTVRFTPTRTVEEMNKRTRAIAEILVDHLADWNLAEKDGSPTPQTADGLLSHDPLTQRAIVDAYVQALIGVPADLGKGSTNGAEVESLPMENLPPNL